MFQVDTGVDMTTYQPGVTLICVLENSGRDFIYQRPLIIIKVECRFVMYAVVALIASQRYMT